MKKIVKFLPLLLLVAALTVVFALHASAAGEKYEVYVSATDATRTTWTNEGKTAYADLKTAMEGIAADMTNIETQGLTKAVWIYVDGTVDTEGTRTTDANNKSHNFGASSVVKDGAGNRILFHVTSYNTASASDYATLTNSYNGGFFSFLNNFHFEKINIVGKRTNSTSAGSVLWQLQSATELYIGEGVAVSTQDQNGTTRAKPTFNAGGSGNNEDIASAKVTILSGDWNRIQFASGYRHNCKSVDFTFGGNATVVYMAGWGVWNADNDGYYARKASATSTTTPNNAFTTEYPTVPEQATCSATVTLKDNCQVTNYNGMICNGRNASSAATTTWDSFTVTGSITTTVQDNAEVKTYYYGTCMTGTLAGNATNTFKNNCVIITSTSSNRGAWGGTSKGTVTGTVTNNIYGGEFDSFVGSTYQSGTVGNVINTVTAGTFNHFFYGGSTQADLTGNITNNISGGTFMLFVGGTNKGTQKGTVTNNISGGDFTYNGDTGSYFIGGAQTDGTVDGDVVNNVSGGTFRTVYMGGSNSTATITGNVTNKITGGTFENYYGANGVVNGSVENKFTGSEGSPISVKAYYGGGASDSQVKNGIVNEIKNGQFIEVKESFYAAGYRGTVAAGEATYAVDTYIENLAMQRFAGGMGNSDATYTAEITGDVYSELVNCTVTSTITSSYYYAGVHGSGHINTIDGDCTVVIRGGEVKAVSGGAIRETGKVTGTMFVTLDLTDDDITMFSLMEPGTEVTLIAGSGTLYLTSAPETINVVDIQDGTPDVEIDGAHDGVVYLTLAAGYGESDVNFTNTGAGDVVFQNQSFVGSVAESVASTIIMEDDFSMRYLFNKSTMDAKNITSVQYSFDNATWTDAPLTSYNDQYYGVLVKGIAAKNIGDTIYMKVPGNDVVDEYSIVEACKVVIANMGKAFSDEFVNLAKTLMNYGAAAKTNFAYEGGADINTYSSAPEASEYTDTSSVGDSTGKSVKIAGTSLLAKDAISIKFYIEVGTEDVSALTAKVNGVDCTMTQNGKYYTVSYVVPARQMRQSATVEVWKSGAVVSNTYVDSISSYCAYVRDNSEDANLKALCKAMMAFVDAAIAYLPPLN